MKQFFLMFVSFACLACLFTGCDRSKPAAGTEGKQAVTLTLDWKPEPEFGGFYSALQSGAFDRNNLTVNINTAAGGISTWQLVDRGRCDYATTSADQVLVARAAGADVVAVFAVYQTNPQGIMTHAGRDLKNLSDVFASEGILAAESNTWLQFLRGKQASVKVKITGYTGGIAAFLARPDYSQQCFITSEPILATRQGASPKTFLIAESGFNPYATVLITRGETLKTQPERVKAMVAAVREGWTAYLKDPKPANEQMAKLNKDMDAQTFEEGAAAQALLIDTGAAPIGTMTLDRWKTLEQQLAGLGVVTDRQEAAKCFVNP